MVSVLKFRAKRQRAKYRQVQGKHCLDILNQRMGPVGYGSIQSTMLSVQSLMDFQTMMQPVHHDEIAKHMMEIYP